MQRQTISQRQSLRRLNHRQPKPTKPNRFTGTISTSSSCSRLLTRALLALAFLAVPLSAWAQSTVIQAGTYTAGRLPMYLQQGSSQPLVQDSGPAGGGPPGVNIKELGITARGNGVPPYANSGTGNYFTNFCMYDAPTTTSTGYHSLCFDPNASGGGLMVYTNMNGAAPLPFNFIVNGTVYNFPFTIGGIVGPNSSVINHFACWNNTSGSLLKDCVGATVTSVGTGLGLTGGPITTTGTISVTGVLADLASISQVQGNIFYYNGSALVALPPGTSGQVLATQGAGANPAWVTSGGGGGGGSGTVSPGSASQLAYYASAGTTVSGLATTNNGVLLTNGSGAPGFGTKSGNTTTVATTSGTFTSGHCVAVDSSSNLIDAGTTCGGGGGGGGVTSINVSGGSTGLTFTGGPITSAGTITATSPFPLVMIASAVAGGNIASFANSSGTQIADSGIHLTSSTMTANSSYSIGTSGTPFGTLYLQSGGFIGGNGIVVNVGGASGGNIATYGASATQIASSGISVTGGASSISPPDATTALGSPSQRFTNIYLSGGGFFQATIRINQNSTDTPGAGNTSTGGSLQSNAQGAAIFLSRSAFAGIYLNVNGSDNVAEFFSSGTGVGHINVTPSATNYATSSDYRLKTDVKPLAGGLDEIKAIKVYDYVWKADGTKGQGVLAHELQAILPVAVSGTKDAVDKDGKMIAQAVDYSKLVPALIAAVQELSAKVDAHK